jgi:hypothetical protein
MNVKRFILILTFLIVSSGNIFSQNSSEQKYIRMAPGAQYEAGSFHEWIFGAHWRDVWVTPIEVPVLDLDKFAGGIIPFRRGGGMQTKSLRFKGNDGNIWKFRSMDKDPSKTLPKLLRKTIAADVLQDQISSANPLAPLIVAPLLDAVGIIHNPPTLVFLPDDPKLGEFREEFGGLMGMMEVHPDVDEDEGIEYKGAEKIEGTFDLFERLADKHKERYAAREFLKARLLDVFLGDWDRHTDQWKWAQYKENDTKYWHPIPRDRDQAFAKFDGWAVRITEYLIPQFNHFGYSYPQVEDITWSGRFIDRRVLPELTKFEWDSVTAFVHNNLTDKVIEDALKVLPKEHYELAAEEIISKLKSRRDKLYEISNEYYELVNSVVDVYASEDEDYVLLNRIDDNQTEIKVFRRDEDNDIDEHELYYYKLFDNNVTSEIRIHLLDKQDKIKLVGEVDKSPLVRIIGGNGKDEIIDQSVVNGYWMYFIPIPDAENKTIVYDSGNKTKIEFGPSTSYNNDKVAEPKDEYEKYEPQQRNRGADWLVNPVVGFDSDNGILVGGGPQLFKYNFRMKPYEYYMSLTAHYATSPNTGTIEYNGVFNSWIKGTSVKLNMLATGLTLTSYYGFGNETKFLEKFEDSDYYELSQGLFSISSAVSFPLLENLDIDLGFTLRYTDTELETPNLLNGFHNYYGGSYGSGIFRYVKGDFSLKFDSRDNEFNTLNGFYFSFDGEYVPALGDNKEDYTSAKFDARMYNYIYSFTEFILASRIVGGKTFGKYPFFDAQFLGGSENLRGFRRERFSGDAMLFGQLEARAFMGNVRLIIPGQWGIHTFIESGRVFVNGRDSDKWHSSYGGGLWISYLERMFNLSATAAHSAEGFRFWFGTSMMF